MTRKILCVSCFNHLVEVAKRYSEPVVGVKGKAIGNYHCDDCNKLLSENTTCVATSVFQAGQSDKTGGWEYEYVIPEVPHRTRVKKFTPQFI